MNIDKEQGNEFVSVYDRLKIFAEEYIPKGYTMETTITPVNNGTSAIAVTSIYIVPGLGSKDDFADYIKLRPEFMSEKILICQGHVKRDQDGDELNRKRFFDIAGTISKSKAMVALGIKVEAPYCSEEMVPSLKKGPYKTYQAPTTTPDKGSKQDMLHRLKIPFTENKDGIIINQSNVKFEQIDILKKSGFAKNGNDMIYKPYVPQQENTPQQTMVTPDQVSTRTDAQTLLDQEGIKWTFDTVEKITFVDQPVVGEMFKLEALGFFKDIDGNVCYVEDM